MACLTVDVFRYLSMFLSFIITGNYVGYLIYSLVADYGFDKFKWLVIAYWFMSVVLNGLNELTKSIFYLSLSFMFMLQALVISIGHFHGIGYLILCYALFISATKFVLEIIIIRYKARQTNANLKRGFDVPDYPQANLLAQPYQPQAPTQSPTIYIIPTTQGTNQAPVNLVIAQPPVAPITPVVNHQPILNTIKTKKSKIEVTILRLVAYLFTIGYFEYCGLRFWLDLFDIPNHAFRPIQLVFPIVLLLVQLNLLYLINIIVYKKDLQLIYAIIFLITCALIFFVTSHYINFGILIAYNIVISGIYICKIYYKKKSDSN